MRQTPFTGTISRIHDHGTIIELTVALNPAQLDAGVGPLVFCDHRCFQWMLDAEGDGTVASLIGREIEVTGDFGVDQAIRFENPESFYDAGAPAGIDQRGSIT